MGWVVDGPLVLTRHPALLGVTVKVLESLPNAEWRLIFSLSRFGATLPKRNFVPDLCPKFRERVLTGPLFYSPFFHRADPLRSQTTRIPKSPNTSKRESPFLSGPSDFASPRVAERHSEFRTEADPPLNT